MSARVLPRNSHVQSQACLAHEAGPVVRRFVTFASPESVERVTAVTHSLHGQELAIDKATPKDRGNAYLAAAAARNVSPASALFKQSQHFMILVNRAEFWSP